MKFGPNGGLVFSMEFMMENTDWLEVRSFLDFPIIPISVQPNNVNLCIFKYRLFYLTNIKVWNIQGLRLLVAKIKGLENQSLWKKNSVPHHLLYFNERGKFAKLIKANEVVGKIEDEYFIILLKMLRNVSLPFEKKKFLIKLYLVEALKWNFTKRKHWVRMRIIIFYL